MSPVWKNTFSRLSGLTLRHPKTVLLLAAILTAVSVYLTQKIAIRTNLADLLPDNHPAVVQARELEKIIGGAGFLVVTAETKNGDASADANATSRFLEDFGRRVSTLKGIQYVDDRPPTEFFKKEALLYLSLSDLDRLTDALRRRIDQGKLKKTRLLVDLEDMPEGEGLSDEITSLQKKYGAFLNLRPRYQNREGTLFVSLIKPSFRATDSSRTREVVGQMNEILKELDPKKYDPSLTIRFTGPYIKQLTQKKILVKDAVVVSAVSFLGAILYLIFHFRRKRAVFLIGIPLTLSTIWAVGLAHIFFGSLNLFSSVACAILLGLAADYGIHIYSEYHRHRRADQTTEEALQLAIGHLGRAFVAASSTTAAAFFSLTLTGFKALHEFGMIAGCGIGLSLIAFLTLFPPLTLLLERWWPEKKGLTEWTEREQRFSTLAIRWIFSPKTLLVTSAFLILPLLAVAGGRLGFDYNLNHILGHQETKELDRRVDAIFGHSVNPEVALVRDREDGGRLARAIRKVQLQNQQTPTGSTIKGVLSLADLIPDFQDEKIEKIKRIQTLFTPLVLKTMSDNEREPYDLLRTMFHPSKVRFESLPALIKNKFQDRTGAVGRIVFIFPNFEMMQGDRFLRFVEEVREVRCTDCSAPFFASGESTVHYEIVKMLFREGRTIIGFTLLSILAALLINFRSLRSTCIVAAPLLLGLAATFGWMALTRTPFNIINLAAIPIILGTVDDYSIHFYQRVVDQIGGTLQDSYRVVFRPIVGSALTTLIGFGSLGLADVGGVRSFGLVCVIGITLCTITTLLWFPAFLKWRGLRPRRAILLLFLLLLPHSLFATSTPNVPVDDPVYRDIDKIVAAGLVKDVIYGQRPWSRREIARIISVAMQNRKEGTLPHIDRILTRLEREYREESAIRLHPLEAVRFDYTFLDSPPRPVPVSNGLGSIDAVINPLVAYQEGRHLADGNTLALETTHRARLSKFFSLYARPRFELLVPREGPNEVNPVVQQLYGKFAYRNFELEAGRDSLIWGQGENGGILLSNNARPLDLIRLSNTSPFIIPSIFKYFGPIRSTFFVANLGPGRDFPFSYLTGAKVSIKPVPFFEMGAAQTLVLGGNGSPAPLNFGNILREFFFNRPEDANLSNRETGFDFRFFVPFLRNTQVYLDVQFEDSEKDKVLMLTELASYQTGLLIPRLTDEGTTSLRLEYRHGSPYFYRHGIWTSGMTLNGRLWGDELGPQADGVYTTAIHDYSPALTLSSSLGYERRAGDELTEVRDPNRRVFIVTHRPAENRLGWLIRGNYRLQEGLNLTMAFGYERIHALNFSSDDDRNAFLGQTSIRWGF